MSKGKHSFREAEVARAHRAARKAGLKSYTLRVERGALEFRVGQPEELPNDLDRELQEFEQRHGSH